MNKIYYNMKKSLFAVIVLLAVGFAAGAQDVVTSSSGSMSGQGGSATFVIGQVAYVSATGADGSSTGVGYGYEVVAVEEVSEGGGEGIAAAEKLEVKIFPNPTTDRVVVQCEGAAKFVLYGTDGALLDSGALEGEAAVLMGRYAAGAYLLRVEQGKKAAAYRIVKK